MSELVVVGPMFIRPRGIRSSFDDITEGRFRAGARDYHALCKARPSENRHKIALVVGAYNFEQKIVDLQSHCEGSPKSRQLMELTDIRQQLMAFSRVVSLTGGPINTWKGIGRAFHRHHSTVIYATKIYGDEIARILGE